MNESRDALSLAGFLASTSEKCRRDGDLAEHIYTVHAKAAAGTFFASSASNFTSRTSPKSYTTSVEQTLDTLEQ